MRKSGAVFGWILLVLVRPVWAGGGGSEVGNGAGAVILPDDRVVLADPYIIRTPMVTLGDLHPMIKAEIERAGRLLVRYGAAVVAPREEWVPPKKFPFPKKDRILSRGGQARLVVENVLDGKVEYHFMETLPPACHSADDVGTTPDGAKLEPVACTEGWFTWINRKLFARMTVREQAKTIIHERLHGVKGKVTHEVIADITDGIETLLSLYFQQSQGERPILSLRQVAQLNLLTKRIDQMGLSEGRPEPDLEFYTHWSVSPNGGGLIQQGASVSPLAYIGVGSLIGYGSVVDPGAEVLNSSCYLSTCHFGSHVSVRDSVIDPGFGDEYSITPLVADIGRGTVLRAVTFSGVVNGDPQFSANVAIGEGSRILGTHLSGLADLRLGAFAGIENSNITFSSVGSSGPRLELGDRASVSGLLAAVIVPHGMVTGRGAILRFPEGKELDMKGLSICEKGGLLFLRDLVTVENDAGLRELCNISFQ